MRSCLNETWRMQVSRCRIIAQIMFTAITKVQVYGIEMRQLFSYVRIYLDHLRNLV